MLAATVTSRRRFKNQIYDLFAGVGKALSNGHRLELLELLAQAERGVEELARATGMSTANTSQHLQVLRRAGLVTARREGVRIIHGVANEAVLDLWRALRIFGEREIPEIERVVDSFLANRSELEAIDAAELHARLRDGSIVLLDVRPAEEYAAGHIPGARSVPIDELARRLDELPDDVELVAYCRGRYCVYSDDAVELLRSRGWRARRLELSVHDFLAAQ